MMFVNLPVESKQRTVEFFGALGFDFNQQFSDDRTACMIVSDACSVMLLERDRFSDFTSKAIADTSTHVEALFALSADSREEVNRLVEAALANGGSPAQEKQDHGFMYGWSFQDPDGHCWEVIWMDPATVEPT